MSIAEPIHMVLQAHKQKALDLSKAMIHSVPGSTWQIEPKKLHLEGTIGFAGAWPTTVHHLRHVVRQGRDWLYIDNAYFAPYKRGGYFRVTANALQHDGRGEGNPELYAQIGPPIRPWQRSGKHILVTLQSDRWLDMFWGGLNHIKAHILQTLRKHTDRPIHFRMKAMADQKPLEEDLKDCHAVVCLSSNAAVEAVLFGVPVFCLAQCAASAMGLNDLALIEAPVYPSGRAEWAHVLAANQWTLAEMHSGKAWGEIRERLDPAKRQHTLG